MNEIKNTCSGESEMLRNRSPLKVDLIVFVVCCLLGTWWIGFEVGKSSVKPIVCPVPAAKVAMYQSRGDVAYWRKYTKSLPEVKR